MLLSPRQPLTYFLSLYSCLNFVISVLTQDFWKDWCWSWNSNTLATWCEELTRWKRPWCWERLRAGREGDVRRWDGWLAFPTQWIWVWVDSGSLWWTGRPGVLRLMGSQRVGYDWVTELNWTDNPVAIYFIFWGSSLYLFSVFLSREDLLAFVEKLVWWCWILSAFAASVKLLISPSYLNEILAGYSNLGCRFCLSSL